MRRSSGLGFAGAAALVASCTFGPVEPMLKMTVPAEFYGAGVADSTMAHMATPVSREGQLRARSVFSAAGVFERLSTSKGGVSKLGASLFIPGFNVTR